MCVAFEKRRYKPARNRCEYDYYKIVNKRYYAVLDFKFVLSERRWQNTQSKQQTVRKTEEEYRITAKYSVIRHFVFSEIDKYRQRSDRVNEKRNRVQNAFF